MVSRKYPKSRSAKREFWQSHVSSWLESGLSKSEYSSLHHSGYSTFKHWYYRFQKEESCGSFLEVSLDSPSPLQEPSSGSVLKLDYRDYHLQIPRSFDGQQLKEVLLCLKKVS